RRCFRTAGAEFKESVATAPFAGRPRYHRPSWVRHPRAKVIDHEHNWLASTRSFRGNPGGYNQAAGHLPGESSRPRPEDVSRPCHKAGRTTAIQTVRN